MQFAAGTMVTQSVRLIEPLARGGMGVVWVAEHLGLESRVAVKFIAPERVERDPTLVTRFRREANIAARLSSPHVVRIFDQGRMDDGTPYMVMELLRGETLGKRLQRERRISLAKTTSILTQLAGVLAGAHALGIVHRDVKPENLFLIDSEYEVFVKLLDFGVAKDGRSPEEARGGATGPAHDTGLTQTGAMLGTLWYMAPEQLVNARDVDHRADLWAMAVVVYHALTGERPFLGKTAAELAAAMHAGSFTPPSAFVEGLPPALDAWFGRAFSVTQEHRFSSASEQARAFVAALRGSESAAATVGMVASETPTEDGVTKPEPSAAAGSSRGRADRDAASRRAAWVALVAAPLLLAGVALAIREESTAATEPPPALASLAPAPAAPAIPPPEDVPPAALVAERTETPLREGAASAAPVSPPPPSGPRARPAQAHLPAASGTARGVTAAAASAGSPSGSPSSAPRARPAYCDTDAAYVVDERGHLRPKPECL